MDNNKVSFKDFLVNYDENKDEFIQYRRRKFRRTDESTQMDEISKDKLYTYYKKSYDDETERRGDAIAQKRNLTPDEKRKNANRKAYRKKAASLITPKPKKVSDAGKAGQRPDGSDERMKFRKAFKQAQKEAVSPLQKIRMDKEKADRNKDDKAKTQVKRVTDKQYAGYKVKLKEETGLEEGLYHVEYGSSGKMAHQVVAKDANDAHQKAMAHLKKKNPKLAHPDYADTFRKPSIYRIKGNEPRADKYKTESVEMDEALTIAQRRKKAIQMKKLKGKIKIGQERARLRIASNEKLLKRARKHARMVLFKKLSKGQGKADIDYARREAIEKRLDKMKGKIDMLAKKLLPSIRKAELSKRQKKDDND